MIKTLLVTGWASWCGVTWAAGQDSVKVITDLSTLKTKPAQMKAINYRQTSWLVGSIYLFNGESLLNQEIRNDLDNNVLEIKAQDETKYLEAYKVRLFEWIAADGSIEKFVNCASYQYSEWIEGFYQILVTGEMSLLVRTEIKSREDQAVSTGFATQRSIGATATHRFVEDNRPDDLEITLLLAAGGKAYDLGKKKETLKMFGDKASKVEQYAKEKNLGFRDRRDLIQLVNYYNSTD